MFDRLKKLFSGAPSQAETHSSSRLETPLATPVNTAFLCREAVFDRKNRLAGHLFYLQDSSPLADAPLERQHELDTMLLATLNASPAAWNTSLAFIPISSASLDLAAVDRLKTENLHLLVQLSPEADPILLAPRINTLRQRGLSVGLFRQPANPAFAELFPLPDVFAIDIESQPPETIRDFSAAMRTRDKTLPLQLFAGRVNTLDEHRFCHQWHFDFFHGRFALTTAKPTEEGTADPHKIQLLHLLRLAQGDAETAEIVAAMKQDPLLAFRILRYLNSPVLGLNHKIDSLAQALTILGRQRLTRWLSVLLFTVREPNFGDWLMVESALTRGQLMELLGAQVMPNESRDSLFLTGIFSCLDKLLRRPLPEILDDMPLSEAVRSALLERSGPYAPLLAVAEASDAFDLPRMHDTAAQAGLQPEDVNRALLAATAWASEVSEHWE